MQRTDLTIGDDYMDFVVKFNDVLRQQKIMLVYEGEINQTITKAFTSMTERNFEGSTDSATTQKRVYHVMVECLQNVVKHTEVEDGYQLGKGNSRGLFMISLTNEFYIITTGNLIANNKIDDMKGILDYVNSLSPDELKAEYKRMMRENRLSEKSGAGLGFIDIIKKTGNKIEYHFEKLNEENSLFIQKSLITRS